MKDIEIVLAKQIGPLAELLGVERVEKLKDKVLDMILEKIQQDIDSEVQTEYFFDADEIREIASEAYDEVKPKIKNRFKKEYLKIAEEISVKYLEK